MSVRRAGLLAIAATAAATLGGSPAARSLAAESGPTVNVAVSRKGFRPPRIALRRGETARFVLTSAGGEHCFALDAFRIEKRIVPGRPTRFDLTPDRAGVFPFYCCLENGEAARTERGELTVEE